MCCITEEISSNVMEDELTCDTCDFKGPNNEGYWTCWIHMLSVFSPKNAGCKAHSKGKERRKLL